MTMANLNVCARIDAMYFHPHFVMTIALCTEIDAILFLLQHNAQRTEAVS